MIEVALEEIVAMERDAARYRWLREYAIEVDLPHYKFDRDYSDSTHLDEMIDNEMMVVGNVHT